MANGDELTNLFFEEFFKKTFEVCAGAAESVWDRVVKRSKRKDFFGLKGKAYQKRLEERYKDIRTLGSDSPVALSSLYVKAKILGELTEVGRMPLKELEDRFDWDKRRFRHGNVKKMRDGLSLVNDLKHFILLGKPGAGKSTFLQYILLSALGGKLVEKRIPVLISLKELADTRRSILDQMWEEFEIGNFKSPELFIGEALKKGKFLILLDGLDEVQPSYIKVLVPEIIDLAERYNENQIIITCRVGAYRHYFDHFVDLEMADFDSRQIKEFIYKWFAKEPSTAMKCWTALTDHKSIGELASNPLLLTLLCNSYHRNYGFPRSRSELYQDALNALLRTHDAKRRIERPTVYKALTVQRKESMFAQIAYKNFNLGRFLFPQPKLEQEIADYLTHLPANKEDEEGDSKNVLESIVADHGIFLPRTASIYAFMHLTFHEFYTAKFIVHKLTKKELTVLIRKHLSNPKWKEVILLTCEMLDPADDFFLIILGLLKEIANQPEIQPILHEANSIIRPETPYSKGTSRSLAILFLLSKFKDQGNHFHLTAMGCALSIAADLDAHFALGGRRNGKKKLHDPSRHTSVLNFAMENVIDPKMRDNENFERIHKGVRAQFLVEYLFNTQLLINCIQTECYVTKEIRQEILDEMLAP